MKNSDIKDPVFRQAVEAIDSGNTDELSKLIAAYPQLLRQRLTVPSEGYFKHPYLIWFIADNPIRNGKLAPAILEITRLLIAAVQREAAGSQSYQIGYTLGLVASGRIPREAGVQLQMIDLLIDAGASPGTGLGAFAHGNMAAGAHLAERSGQLTLATAVCMDRLEEAKQLAATASAAEKQVALIAAAFFGKAPMIRFLISLGIDPNVYPDPSFGFHSHATALHQAVYAGSLESVKLLVEAGADTGMKDKIYNGTPLGWAAYALEGDETPTEHRKKIEAILVYLQSK